MDNFQSHEKYSENHFAQCPSPVTMTLKDIAIFKLKPLVTNFTAKLSATTAPVSDTEQVLCLVHENNDLFFRYTGPGPGSGPSPSDVRVIVKLLPWFNERGKSIVDIAFDQSPKWNLLVLCDDNTLHIVPVQAIVYEAATAASHTGASSSSQADTIITSFVIPFSPPHECPNPRTCPNNFYKPPTLELERTLKSIGPERGAGRTMTLDDLYSKQRIDKLLSTYDVPSTYFCDLQQQRQQLESDDSCVTPGPFSKATTTTATATENNIMCPYPESVVWWATIKGQQRAVVGYSDGSICFLCKLSRLWHGELDLN